MKCSSFDKDFRSGSLVYVDWWIQKTNVPISLLKLMLHTFTVDHIGSDEEKLIKKNANFCLNLFIFLPLYLLRNTLYLQKQPFIYSFL